ncbi:PREDICTED: uncharacterized protein LOC108609637 [Drosophila arizonae]|uniref:Uncharacterized protein LOC108609637 n=1 Tax=Drosophila arizonae TaxID=7263 RepID=A0ABM1NPG1_DROAR|nr:PREDICTED: uncharacterized protein LOC108609637 [Drosophila arizonae]
MKSLCLLLLLVSSSIGVRCQLQCNSGSSARQKRIVIRNPGAGELSKLASCHYEVAPWSAQVCQVRIDFERLELAQPKLNASTQLLECVDFVQVQRFQLCGRNNGQHLYVHLQRGQTLKLHFNLASHSTQSTWQLTLTQIECLQQHTQQPAAAPAAASAPQLPTVRPLLPLLSNLLPRTIFGANSAGGPAAQLIQTLTAPSPADLELQAPLGCDQYWRSSSGGIVSFNFAGGVYMANMKYAICVAGGADREISYKIEHFALSKFNGAPGPGYDTDCHSTVRTMGRASDYLLIPNSYVADNQALQPTYYCGNGLAGSKLIARPPFVIHFSSDAQTSDTETGFQLTYAVTKAV